MYRKILVPVDGSATSDRGFQEALSLAQQTGATLLILHVADTFPLTVGMEMATADTWQQVSVALRKHGQDIVDRAHRAAVARHVAAENRLVEGSTGQVADAIIETARLAQCDLIVMGTHGRRGFSHFALGSDAERVARQSPVPLLLVRHGESAAQ